MLEGGTTRLSVLNASREVYALARADGSAENCGMPMAARSGSRRDYRGPRVLRNGNYAFATISSGGAITDARPASPSNRIEP